MNILVTAIGTASATAIVTQLNKLKSEIPIHIIGADIYQRYEVGTAKFVDEFYQFPSAVEDQEKYFDFLLDFCRRHRIDYLYSTIDEEVVSMCRHRNELMQIGVVLCNANSEAVFLVHDKVGFGRWIAKEFPELYIRTFENIELISGFDLPIFIKPRNGRASIGCMKVSTEAELENIKTQINNEKVVIQEYTKGDIIVADVIRNRTYKTLRVIQRLEMLRNSSGCGIAVKIIKDKRIDRICQDIAEKLDLNGVVNMEFFKDGDSLKIIEVNPRFSAGTMYTCLAGYDLVKNSLNIARGLPCIDEHVTVGGYYAKRYEVIKL